LFGRRRLLKLIWVEPTPTKGLVNQKTIRTVKLRTEGSLQKDQRGVRLLVVIEVSSGPRTEHQRISWGSPLAESVHRVRIQTGGIR
jgi:hypothetical protein